MSRMSKVMESALRHSDFKKETGDTKTAIEKMEKRSADEDETYTLPKRRYQSEVRSMQMFGCQMIVFDGSESTQNVVIYLHGGAYVSEITLLHIAFCDKVAKKANATVIAPIYPLTPNHTYDETYEIVEKLYKSLLESEKPVTVMGDSAGGGLTAAFCQYLGENSIEMPERQILISPWVDVSMSGDYSGYDEKDPMLGVDGLREMGKAWSGDLDMTDYKVSPLFGNTDNQPKTTIFIGTHEIFYPDVMKFADKLKKSGVEVDLNVGNEMSHVYPLYPMVPEAKDAADKIIRTISQSG